jgi:hypothetical protein
LPHVFTVDGLRVIKGKTLSLQVLRRSEKGSFTPSCHPMTGRTSLDDSGLGVKRHTEGGMNAAKLLRACGGCLGARRMGVEDCDKLGGAVKRVLIPRCPIQPGTTSGSVPQVIGRRASENREALVGCRWSAEQAFDRKHEPAARLTSPILRGKSGHHRARWSGNRPGETRGKVPQK